MRPANLFLLTTDKSLVQVVREAAEAASPPLDLTVFDITTDALATLVDPNRFKPEMVFVDVATIPDGTRFIDFIKSSGPTRELPIVTVVDEPKSLPAVFSQRVGATALLKKPAVANAVTETFERLRTSGCRGNATLRAAH